MALRIDQVQYATLRAHQRKDLVVSRALNVLADPNKDQRLRECFCPACFYLDHGLFTGQAFTEWVCEACEVSQPAWPNTAHPKLCSACAKQLGLCVRCLADLSLALRTKLKRKGK